MINKLKNFFKTNNVLKLEILNDINKKISLLKNNIVVDEVEIYIINENIIFNEKNEKINLKYLISENIISNSFINNEFYILNNANTEITNSDKNFAYKLIYPIINEKEETKCVIVFKNNTHKYELKDIWSLNNYKNNILEIFKKYDLNPLNKNNLIDNKLNFEHKEYEDILVHFIDLLNPHLKLLSYRYNTLKIFQDLGDTLENRELFLNDYFLIRNKKITNQNNFIRVTLTEMREYFLEETEIKIKFILDNNKNKSMYNTIILPSNNKNINENDEEYIIEEFTNNLILLKEFILITDIENKKEILSFIDLVDNIRHFIHQTINIVNLFDLILLEKILFKEIKKQKILKDTEYFIYNINASKYRLLRFYKQLKELKLLSDNKEIIIIEKYNFTLLDIKQMLLLYRKRANDFIYKDTTYNITFNVNLHSNENIVINSNLEKLDEIMETLIQNSLEELAEKDYESDKDNPKYINIDIEEIENFIYININDSGRGIPSKNLPKIFDKYYTTGKLNGSGIGLAAVKKLTEKLDILIKVDSKENIGTTFTLIIPKN